MASLVGWFRDLVDANTESDRRKRRQRGEPEWYADQQRARGNRRPAQNIGAQFLGSVGRVANTIGATAQEAPATASALTALLTNNQQALTNANKTLAKIRQRTRKPDTGLFRTGTIYNSPNDTPSPAETAKRFGGAYLGAAGEIAPVPALKAVRGANLLSRAGKIGLVSGGANIGADTGRQLAETGRIDPKQLAVAGGAGLALGTALPLAGAGARGATRYVRDNPLNEVGSVGKNIDKPNLNKGAFSKADRKYLESLNAEDLANLSSKEQMALHELQGFGPPSKTQVATGLKKNPYKSNIHEVAPNNWVGARTAGDAVSAPIKTAGQIADYHLGRLAKDNPKLHNKFWDTISKGTVPKDAPPSFRTAAKWFRETANGIHKESNILGTPTRYQKNWDLRAASLKDVTPEQLGSGELGSVAKHAIKRKYATHAEFVKAAEKAGLKVEKDPRTALRKYVAATSSSLQRKAVVKSLAEADRNNLTKPHTVDLGWGNVVKLSDEGLHQARGVLKMSPKKTKIGTVYDASNSFRKGLLLSVSQFHTVNIAGLRAAPSLAMPKPGYLLKGDLTAGSHPIRAARGLYGVTRAALPGGKKYVTNRLEDAYNRGDIQFAARHGSPFGKTSYGASKHFNIGHKTVFEKQLPMIHKEVIGALRRDLKKFGIKEGSPEALEAGKVANFTMGFINRAAMNMSPTLVKAIERTMLAGQFTPSKLANLYKGTTTRGLAGSMARADVVANAITAGAMIVGVGWLVRQKSDNIRDAVLKALINPAIPTPFKDKKGNTQEIRIPMTYTSEVAHILGIKLVRQKDGHLGVSFNPKKFFSSDSPAAEWARARLSPNLSTIVKVKTNTEFGNKPLYQEGVSHAKQAIQVATKEAQGALPIGLQGLGYTEAVKKRLPGSSREVLEAGTPSSNPLIKSLASSTGFSVRTDRTTGKALESGRYFEAKDKVKSTLKNAQSKAAFELYTGSKKDPVTGKYNVQPTVWDTIAKAAAINQNPQALNALVEMNKKVAGAGGKVDPLWLEPKQNIKKYFQYQAISDPFSNQRTVWYDKNKKWYQPLSEKRGKFFDSLPPSDPNKPSAPVEYPTPSKTVQAQKEKYFSIKDSKKRFDYINNHPGLKNQMDKEFKYKNDLLKARGYAKHKAYPKVPTGWMSGKGNGGYSRYGKSGSGSGGSITKTAKYVDTKAPKGVRVRKLPVPKAPAPKKIPVSKIKSNYLSRKLG